MTTATEAADEVLDPILADLIRKAEGLIEPVSGHAELFHRGYDRAEEIGEVDIAEDMRREALL